MKKLFFLLTLLVFAAVSYEFSSVRSAILQSTVMPPKTIILKHPGAEDLNVFFAQTTVFTIYVYQCGTAQDLQSIVGKLSKDKVVSSCVPASANGDYQAINVNLKQTQNKTWFVSWLKSAGLKTMKVNNGTLISLDQL